MTKIFVSLKFNLNFAWNNKQKCGFILSNRIWFLLILLFNLIVMCAYVIFQVCVHDVLSRSSFRRSDVARVGLSWRVRRARRPIWRSSWSVWRSSWSVWRSSWSVRWSRWRVRWSRWRVWRSCWSVCRSRRVAQSRGVWRRRIAWSAIVFGSRAVGDIRGRRVHGDRGRWVGLFGWRVHSRRVCSRGRAIRLFRVWWWGFCGVFVFMVVTFGRRHCDVSRWGRVHYWLVVIGFGDIIAAARIRVVTRWLVFGSRSGILWWRSVDGFGCGVARGRRGIARRRVFWCGGRSVDGFRYCVARGRRGVGRRRVFRCVGRSVDGFGYGITQGRRGVAGRRVARRRIARCRVFLLRVAYWCLCVRRAGSGVARSGGWIARRRVAGRRVFRLRVAGRCRVKTGCRSGVASRSWVCRCWGGRVGRFLDIGRWRWRIWRVRWRGSGVLVLCRIFAFWRSHWIRCSRFVIGFISMWRIFSGGANVLWSFVFGRRVRCWFVRRSRILLVRWFVVADVTGRRVFRSRRGSVAWIGNGVAGSWSGVARWRILWSRRRSIARVGNGVASSWCGVAGRRILWSTRRRVAWIRHCVTWGRVA